MDEACGCCFGSVRMVLKYPGNQVDGLPRRSANTQTAKCPSRVSLGYSSPVLRHCATGGWPGGSRRSQAGGQVLPCRRPASEMKLDGWWEVVNPSTTVGTGMSALTVSGEFCMFVVNLHSADMVAITSARTACLHLRRRCCEPIECEPSPYELGWTTGSWRKD